MEIEAIQRYSNVASLEYVPVLDVSLPDAFETKSALVCENIEFRNMLDSYNALACELGFQFLNSPESIKLQEEMRKFEDLLLKNSDTNKAAIEEIHKYETSMIRNIYSYCSKNPFGTAIFMCGVAHRKSIIEKLEKYNSQEEISLDWISYES